MRARPSAAYDLEHKVRGGEPPSAPQEAAKPMAGYFRVEARHWHHISRGSEIRLRLRSDNTVMRAATSGCSNAARVGIGNEWSGPLYVRQVSTDVHGARSFTLAEMPNRIMSRPFADIAELWKRCHDGAYLEIKMINDSMRLMRTQMAEMQAEIDSLRGELYDRDSRNRSDDDLDDVADYN